MVAGMAAGMVGTVVGAVVAAGVELVVAAADLAALLLFRGDMLAFPF
jgi:hypothetical protein